MRYPGSVATTLTDFPRPNVAVDLALLSVRPSADSPVGEMVTLIQDRLEAPRGRVLPGRFMRERQTIHSTVEALLRDKLHLSPSDITPRLLQVFDDPARDERAWTLSIAHAVALPWLEVASAEGTWHTVDESGSIGRTKLLFDHGEILREAVNDMRDRYETDPDPDRLLRGPFTLLDLRRLHEAVIGTPLRKDTFNRRMRDQLEPTDAEPTEPRVGRPAQHYVHPRRSLSLSDCLWRLPRAD